MVKFLSLLLLPTERVITFIFSGDREQSDAEGKELVVLCVYVFSVITQNIMTTSS